MGDGDDTLINEGYSVKMNEDFGPVPSYKPYLLLLITIVAVVFWFCIIGWAPLLVFDPTFPIIIAYISIGILPVILIIGIIWALLYFDTVQYHMNETEITWKRGVWFHSTGIVPYNRMTDVNIIQGPIMRRFGVSHLRIQTAGTSAGKVAEITIEGMNRAEELRGIIIERMRGKSAGGATIGVVSDEVPKTEISQLLAEVREIRSLLEKK